MATSLILRAAKDNDDVVIIKLDFWVRSFIHVQRLYHSSLSITFRAGLLPFPLASGSFSSRCRKRGRPKVFPFSKITHIHLYVYGNPRQDSGQCYEEVPISSQRGGGGIINPHV